MKHYHALILTYCSVPPVMLSEGVLQFLWAALALIWLVMSVYLLATENAERDAKND